MIRPFRTHFTAGDGFPEIRHWKVKRSNQLRIWTNPTRRCFLWFACSAWFLLLEQGEKIKQAFGPAERIELNWEGDGIFSSLERVSRPPVQCKRVARSPVCRKGLLREMHPPAISPCHQMPAPHSLCKVVLQSVGVNRGGQLERSKLHPLVLPQLLFRSCLISTVVTGRGAGKVCSGSCTPLCHLMPAPQSLCKALLLHFSHKLELPPFTRPATAWQQTTLHLVRVRQLGREKERD